MFQNCVLFFSSFGGRIIIIIIIIIVRASFGSQTQKVKGLRPKEPNTKNLKRVGWKLGFGELDNAHNGLKIEIKYRGVQKTDEPNKPVETD